MNRSREGRLIVKRAAQTLENRDRVYWRPCASDYVQWIDRQHELVSVLLSAGIGKGLQQRIVEQGDAVGEYNAVD